MKTMKKLLSLAIALLLSSYCLAQENEVKRLPEKPHTSNYRDYSTTDNGYWTAVELNGGATAMTGRRNLPFAEGTWVNGYRFNEFLRVGVGFGAKYYFNNDDVRTKSSPWVFPLYADFRGNIISMYNRTVVPYWSADIGSEIRNGFFFSPTIGLRIGEARNAFLIGINYRIGTMDTKKKENEARSMFALKIGYEF